MEIAILALLVSIAAWVREDGPPPYPLADACQDHALALAVDEPVVVGRPVELTVGPWSPDLGLATGKAPGESAQSGWVMSGPYLRRKRLPAAIPLTSPSPGVTK